VKGVVFLVVISEVAELITHWTNDASPAISNNNTTQRTRPTMPHLRQQQHNT